jgi:hypothetical protein
MRGERGGAGASACQPGMAYPGVGSRKRLPHLFDRTRVLRPVGLEGPRRASVEKPYYSAPALMPPGGRS